MKRKASGKRLDVDKYLNRVSSNCVLKHQAKRTQSQDGLDRNSVYRPARRSPMFSIDIYEVY